MSAFSEAKAEKLLKKCPEVRAPISPTSWNINCKRLLRVTDLLKPPSRPLPLVERRFRSLQGPTLFCLFSVRSLTISPCGRYRRCLEALAGLLITLVVGWSLIPAQQPPSIHALSSQPFSPCPGTPPQEWSLYNTRNMSRPNSRHTFMPRRPNLSPLVLARLLRSGRCTTPETCRELTRRARG